MSARLHYVTRLLVALGAFWLALGSSRAAHALPCTRDSQCPPDAKTGETQVCEETHCQVDHARNIPPFSFFVPGQEGYRYLPLLLYFRSSTAQSRTAIQFPFYFRYDVRSDKPPLRSQTMVLPLLLYSQTTTTAYHNWRVWPLVFHDVFTLAGKDEGYSTTVVPFAYWSHRNGRKWLILPPLLSGGFHEDKTDTTQLTIGLLGYYKRVKADVWRVFFPLFFDHETKTERRVLAPLFYYRRTPEFRTTVVFPLLYNVRDKAHTHTSVLPFVDYDSTSDGKKAHALTLLGGWSRDKDAGTSDWYATVPPLFHHRDPKRTIDIGAPVYAHWAAFEDHSSGYLVFPFVRQATPRGSVNTFAGLFWHLTDTASKGSTSFLFPVAGFHQHPGAAGGFIGPIYGWGSHNTGSWGGGVFPLLFFGKTVAPTGTRRHAFLFPLFEHASDDGAGTSTTVVGPGFFHRRSGAQGWDAGLAPLIYFGGRPGGGYGGVVPLFFHYKDREADGIHQTNIVGPVFCSARPDGYTSGVFPLLFVGKSHRGDALKSSGYQVLFPFLFRFTDGERKDGSAQNERVASLLFFRQRHGDDATSVFFPLVYAHTTPERTVVATILGGYSRDEAKQTRTLVIGPWISHIDDLHERATHLLFPLAVAYRSPGYSVTTVLPPIFWRVHEGHETDTVLFPFYWRVRRPGFSADVIFPLGGHSQSADASMTVVGPFWSRSATHDRRSVGLFPLFAYYRQPVTAGSSSSFRFLGTPFGFWAHNDATATTRSIFTLAFSFSSPTASTAGLFPLVWHWRRGSASSTLLPFIFHRQDPAQDDSFTVVGPLYFGHHERDSRVGLLPLFFHHADDNGSRNLMLPLFYYNQRHDGSTVATLLFGWATHPDDKMFYAGLFSYRHYQNTRAYGFWPLLYFSHDTVSDATTRLVLPVYFHKQFADGRTVSAFTPLLWHYRSVERSTFVGFPLVYDDHVFEESRTTAVVPLFYRNHSEVDSRTNWLFPPLLLWVRTRPLDHAGDAVLFPIFYHFGGTDRSTTIGFPLYWDIVRGDSRTTVAFPVAYYWRRETAENWLVLNTFYTRGRGPETGSWHFHFIPLFDVGRPHPHDIDWNILYGLFGYKRIGRNRSLKLFWLFDAQLEPAPRSTTMSWFGGGTDPKTRTTF